MAAPAAEQTISRAEARYALGVFVVVYIFNFVDRQIPSILLQPIKEDLQVSDTAMGFLTGFAFALFYTFAGIPIARWADRGTRRSIMALGLTLWSAMTALSGLARSFAQLATARVLVGVGEAAATPAAHSMISDLFPPERRATALAIYTSGASVGILIGLSLGGWISQAFDWRVAFFVVGLPGLLVAAVVRFTIREPLRGAAEGLASDADPPSLREVVEHMWRLRSFRHMSAAAALYALAGYALMTWTPTFMIRIYAMNIAEAGFWAGLIVGGGNAVGTLLGGVIADRLAARDVRWMMRLPAITAAAAVPFTVAFLFLPDSTAAMLALVPSVVLGIFYAAPTFSMTQGLARLRMRALASAVILFVINLIGMGLGPQIVGILNDVLAGAFGLDAIRVSLLVVTLVNFWAIAHSLLAARTLREDLAATRESTGTGEGLAGSGAAQ